MKEKVYRLDSKDYTHLVICNVQGREVPVGLFTNGMDAKMFIEGMPKGTQDNYKTITNFFMGED